MLITSHTTWVGTATSQVRGRRGDLFWAVAICFALLLGLTLGTEKWLYAFAIAMLPLVFLRPLEICLGAFAFLIPFDSVDVIGGQNEGTTMTWFIGAAAAAVLLLVGLARGNLTRPGRDIIAWGLFVGWSLLTTAWAVSGDMAFSSVPTALSLFAMYCATSLIRVGENEIKWVFGCITVGGVIASLYSISLYFYGITLQGGRGSLIMGDRATDPNGFALSLLLPFSLALGAFITARRGPMKIVSLVAMALILGSIFLTMSRGGSFALLAIAAVYLFRYRLKVRSLVPVFLSALLLLALPNLFFHRLAESVDTGGAGRLYIWEVGLAALNKYWAFGAGLGNFPAAFDQFAGSASTFVGFGRGAHNIYLSTFVELGIVGMFLLAYAIRTELRQRGLAETTSPFHLAVACEAASWGMLIAGLFLDILWKKAFWLVWMMLALVTRLQDSRVRISERSVI